MNDRIYIVPTGGLCNRMRAMASGIYLSQQTHHPVTIYWNNTQGLCADFNKLFMPIENKHIDVVENKKWLYRIEGTRDYILRWPFLHYMHKVIFNYSKERKGNLLLHTDIHKSTLLISCYSMGQHLNLKKLFVPQPDIQSQIDKITANFKGNTIGVHIRRTDNTQSIQNSPTESFYRILMMEISKDPSVKFYLATDNQSIKNDFTKKFQDRIITYDCKMERNSLEGMKSAVIELFCLSMTIKIIGSDYSSYSQIAAEIGGIELEYARAR